MRGRKERQGLKDVTWALNPAMTKAKASLLYHEPVSSHHSSQFHLGFCHPPCLLLHSSTYLLSPSIESLKYKVRAEDNCSSLASFVLHEDTWPLGRAYLAKFQPSEPCHCLALLLTYFCSLELTLSSLLIVFPDCEWNPEPFLFANEFLNIEPKPCFFS